MNVEAVFFLSVFRADKLDGNKWRLARPFTAKITFDTPEVEEILMVPEGFVTDLASVPRLPFMFWLLGDRAHRSAVLHDYLYRLRRNREFADAVFYAAMRAEKLNGVQRGLMWLGVRVGGWPAYL